MKVAAVVSIIFVALSVQAQEYYKTENEKFVLTQAGASHFSQLPLRCMQQEFPYKTGIVFSDTSLITKPKVYHPAFYGCFDWHSCVHGHWMMIKLLKEFRDLPSFIVHCLMGPT